jgi:hypothetical protein
LAHELSQVV